MLFKEFPNPAVIAHRGASAYAPENTLAAFKLALQQGADGIELDAKLTADGQVVVIHDATVDRTTPHHGRVVDFRLNDLRKMDAGSHFDIAFKGEPIPSLEEVFKAVGLLTIINVELTNYAAPNDSLPDKVAELVHRHKLAGRVIFSSFNPIALIRIRRLVPEAPVGLLTAPGPRGALLRSWIGGLLGYDALHPHYGDVTPSLVARAHRRGRKVFTWTVNPEDEIRRLIALNVDGIITDDPILGRRLAGTAAQQSPHSSTERP